MVASPLVLIEEETLVVAVVSKKFGRGSRVDFGLTKFSSDRSRRLPAVVRSARAGSR